MTNIELLAGRDVALGSEDIGPQQHEFTCGNRYFRRPNAERGGGPLKAEDRLKRIVR
jgi:hypothetical protein